MPNLELKLARIYINVYLSIVQISLHFIISNPGSMTSIFQALLPL